MDDSESRWSMGCIRENSRLERILANSNFEITWSIRQQNPTSETEQRQLNKETTGVWAGLRAAVGVVGTQRLATVGRHHPQDHRSSGRAVVPQNPIEQQGWWGWLPAEFVFKEAGMQQMTDSLWKQGSYREEEGECPPRWKPAGNSLARILNECLPSSASRVPNRAEEDSKWMGMAAGVAVKSNQHIFNLKNEISINTKSCWAIKRVRRAQGSNNY